MVFPSLAQRHQLIYYHRIPSAKGNCAADGNAHGSRLTMLFVPVTPPMGCLAGHTEAFCIFCDGVIVQKIVFDESFALLAHGNTLLGHGHRPLLKLSVTNVL